MAVSSPGNAPGFEPFIPPIYPISPMGVKHRPELPGPVSGASSIGMSNTGNLPI